MNRSNRREFLGTLGAATAAYWATPAVSARAASPAETLRVACIGTGGRCRYLMGSLRKIPNVKITAVCDVWDESLAAGRKLAEPNAIATKDYRTLLDRDDIDAVLIGTPDHLHTPMTIAACEAGKDVYVEKPLTHEASEGAAVIEAQNKYRRIVQVGTQQRSMPQYQKAREIVQNGELGEIHKIQLSWNRNSPRGKEQVVIDPKTVDWKAFLGNAPDQPFDVYRFRNWRWFWDFGGGIFTDLMVHQIDIAHWILDLPTPAVAYSQGDQFLGNAQWQTPDTVQTLLHYPAQKIQAHFEGTFSNARGGASLTFMGTQASLYVDRGRYQLIPERHSPTKASEMILGSGPAGQDFYDQPNGEMLHLVNWIDCIRSRQKPVAPAEAGVNAASAAHLANLALKQGGTARS